MLKELRLTLEREVLSGGFYELRAVWSPNLQDYTINIPSIYIAREDFNLSLPATIDGLFNRMSFNLQAYGMVHPVDNKLYTVTDMSVAKEVNEMDDKLKQQIEKSFVYHPPKEGQPAKYTEIREKAKELALLIADLCSDSRERSLAITKLQESVMWANASIAINE